MATRRSGRGRRRDETRKLRDRVGAWTLGRGGSRSVLRRALSAALVLLLVGLYAIFGGSFRALVGLEGAAPPAASDTTLRVITWNLRNFPEPEEDLELVRSTVEVLQPALLVVQELRDPDALAALFPEHRVLASTRGGRGGQKLAFVYDPARLEPTGPTVEHLELTLGGSVRPAFAAPFRVRGAGFGGDTEDKGAQLDFVAIAVHLKAMPDGLELRRAQWSALASIVDAIRGARDGALVGSSGEPDVIVLGDFNPVGGPRDEPSGVDAPDELADLTKALGRAGLRPVPSDLPCTAYWDGVRRDAWKEPSVLDLVWVAGFDTVLAEGARTHVGGFCAKARCEPLRSTAAQPEPALELVSDHCPVVLDIPLPPA